MIPEKLKQIITLLKDKTLSKKAIWNNASGGEQYKLLTGGGSSIVVTLLYGNYNAEYYEVAVYNTDGQAVEIYSSEAENDHDDLMLIKSFHKAARDSYYKVDETMDSLLEELSKQDIIGEKETIIPPPTFSSPEEDDLPF